MDDLTLYMAGLVAAGLILGAIVGAIDEDGAFRTGFLTALGVIGLGGVLTLWNPMNSACQMRERAGTLDASSACEVEAWAGMGGLAFGLAACGAAYAGVRGWMSSRRSPGG